MHTLFSKIGPPIFLVSCVVLLIILCTGVFIRIQHMDRQAHDAEMFRSFSWGFDQYHKKFGAYPCLLNNVPATTTAPEAAAPARDIQLLRSAPGRPACLALKLFMHTALIEYPAEFFSFRDEPATRTTLTSMSKNPNPYQDPAFACTWASDPGHTQADGAAILFGTRRQTVAGWSYSTVIVLNCNLIQSELEPDAQDAYVIHHPVAGSTAIVRDDIYADDSPALGCLDSFLQWDVPANLP